MMFSSCADVDCPDGQRCRQGACETDPCGHACPFGQSCNDTTGNCIENPCKFRECLAGEWCNPNDGQCESDPCCINNICGASCPATATDCSACPNPGEVCRGGTCLDPQDEELDGGNESHVTVGGGGGCNTGGGSSGALIAGLALILRRRKRVRAVQGGGIQ